MRCLCQVFTDGRQRRCTAEATAVRNGHPVCPDHTEPVKDK